MIIRSLIAALVPRYAAPRRPMATMLPKPDRLTVMRPVAVIEGWDATGKKLLPVYAFTDEQADTIFKALCADDDLCTVVRTYIS